MDLYERIAADYDDVTGERDRLEPAAAFLAELRRRHPFASAIDIACGTGLHAVLLAGMGVRVTAADLSPAMLQRARRRAEAVGAEVTWVEAPMQRLERHVAAGGFEAALCLGNSLPHLLEPAELTAAVRAFAHVLTGGGLLTVHLLNYARVLTRRERVVGVTRRGDVEFVRFYDFLDGRLRFNVLRLRWHAGCCEHELTDALLRPYTAGDVAAAVAAGPFDDVRLYGGLRFEPFDAAASETVLLLARRTVRS